MGAADRLNDPELGRAGGEARAGAVAAGAMTPTAGGADTLAVPSPDVTLRGAGAKLESGAVEVPVGLFRVRRLSARICPKLGEGAEAMVLERREESPSGLPAAGAMVGTIAGIGVPHPSLTACVDGMGRPGGVHRGCP
jgi:hypothetical protein